MDFNHSTVSQTYLILISNKFYCMLIDGQFQFRPMSIGTHGFLPTKNEDGTVEIIGSDTCDEALSKLQKICAALDRYPFDIDPEYINDGTQSSRHICLRGFGNKQLDRADTLENQIELLVQPNTGSCEQSTQYSNKLTDPNYRT